MKINGQEVKTVFVIERDNEDKPELHEYLFVKDGRDRGGEFVTYFDGVEELYSYTSNGNIFDRKEDALATIRIRTHNQSEFAKEKLKQVQMEIMEYEEDISREVKIIPLTFS